MILAFDLGKIVGVAVGADAPALSQVELPKTLGQMMLHFEGAVRGQIREHDPTLLVWERPFLSFAAKDAQGELRTQRLYGQAAIMAKLAYEFRLHCASERPNVVRKKIVGSGTAKAEDIMRFCVKQGVHPISDHCADAYVMWRYAKEVQDGRIRTAKAAS